MITDKNIVGCEIDMSSRFGIRQQLDQLGMNNSIQKTQLNQRITLFDVKNSFQSVLLQINQVFQSSQKINILKTNQYQHLLQKAELILYKLSEQLKQLIPIKILSQFTNKEIRKTFSQPCYKFNILASKLRFKQLAYQIYIQMIETQRHLDKNNKKISDALYQEQFYQKKFLCFFTEKNLVVIKKGTLLIYKGVEHYSEKLEKPYLQFDLINTYCTLYETSIEISNINVSHTFRHPKSIKLLKLLEAIEKARYSTFEEGLYRKKLRYYESSESDKTQ